MGLCGKPLYADGRLYFRYENGQMLLIEATPESYREGSSVEIPSVEKPMDAFMRSGGLLPFFLPFNVTGQPAISLPLHMSGDGLPVGVQFVAAAGREDLLLRLAAQLEADVRWSERQPTIHA